MARPDARSSQVASLLGVTPVADPGQPVRLALNAGQTLPAVADSSLGYAEATPSAAPVYAEANAAPAAIYAVVAQTPAPVPAEAETSPVIAPDSAPVSDWGLPAEAEAPAQAAASAPAVVAEISVPAEEAPSYYLPPAPEAPPAPRSTEQVRYAAAAETLNRPEPAVVRTAAVSLPPAPVFRREAPRPAGAQVRRGNSSFVVQLGSFSVEGNAERAWVDAERRFALGEHQPLTTTFDHGGRTLHRVSVAGFASHGDARQLCQSIRARGGACFVRSQAGDAAVRWAAQYGPRRTRDA
jgi:hypothetical protein